MLTQLTRPRRERNLRRDMKRRNMKECRTQAYEYNFIVISNLSRLVEQAVADTPSGEIARAGLKRINLEIADLAARAEEASQNWRGPIQKMHSPNPASQKTYH
jgi:hypothetical protein